MAFIVKKSLNTYEVQIEDCLLKLKTNHNSSTLHEIIKVIEQKILDSKEHNKTLSSQKIFALCCFNVAEELICLKKSLHRQLNQLETSANYIFSEVKSSSKNLSK